MSRKRFYQVSILVTITASLLIGFLIERQKAIHQAILACDQDYGLQPPEPPTTIQAKLTTYGSTLSPTQNRDLWWPTDAGRLVWFVRLEGKWLLVGGPALAENHPGPSYTNECVIVIDVLTGEAQTEPYE
jgi:hypothetical protein